MTGSLSLRATPEQALRHLAARSVNNKLTIVAGANIATTATNLVELASYTAPAGKSAQIDEITINVVQGTVTGTYTLHIRVIRPTPALTIVKRILAGATVNHVLLNMGTLEAGDKIQVWLVTKSADAAPKTVDITISAIEQGMQ